MAWCRSRSGVLLLLLLAWQWGCSTVPAPANGPYFTPDAADGKMLQMLVKKQDALIAKCGAGAKGTCDHVFFTRALAALYENRETALRYFEKVIAAAPKSQLAASSKLWIQVLQGGHVPANRSWVQSVADGPAVSRTNLVLSQAAERTVRDLLDRELVIQQLRSMQEADTQSVESLHRELQEQEKKVEALSSRRDSARMTTDTGTVQSLQRQLNERDRKIEELTSQLEALKRIDQEMREKIRPIRPPSNIAPPSPPESTKP
jgi:predicted RNase H-like nuclease (RuvC/YqgF family)